MQPKTSSLLTILSLSSGVISVVGNTCHSCTVTTCQLGARLLCQQVYLAAIILDCCLQLIVLTYAHLWQFFLTMLYIMMMMFCICVGLKSKIEKTQSMFIKENAKRMQTQTIKEVKDESFDNNQEESGYLTDLEATKDNSFNLETDEESSKWDHESLDDFLDIDLSVIVKSGDNEDNLNDTADSEACEHDPNNNTDFDDLNTAFANNTRFSDIFKNGVNETCSYSKDCNDDLNTTRCSNSSMMCQVDLNDDNEDKIKNVGEDFPEDLMKYEAYGRVKEVEVEESTDAMSVNECIIADLAEVLDFQSGIHEDEKNDYVFDNLETYNNIVAIDDHLEAESPQAEVTNYLELFNVSNFDS